LPTGAPQWNPIEHGLFSEVSRNWAREPLDSYQKIPNFARTTQPQTGLQVTAYLDRHFYPCGLKPHRIKLLPFDCSAMKLISDVRDKTSER
jgi:hypothetical protein